MTAGWTVTLRGILIAAAGLAYYLVAYHASAAENVSLPAALFGALPVIAVVLVLSWRSGRHTVLIATCITLGGGFMLVWPTLQAHPSWMFFLQHLLGNLLLAFIFGRSLFGGRQALVSYFASFSHRPTMSPLVARYTRQVTVGWTIFFLSMAGVSALLFALAPIETWSVFANLLALPLVVGMFLGEYLVRRQVVPAHERTSILGSIRAYRMSLARPDTTHEERP